MTQPGTPPTPADYDPFAERYAEMVAWREADPARDLILAPLLAEMGDVAGLRTLDAACGEGYLARILARRGAIVTGADLSARLIALAQGRAAATPDDPPIRYLVADLSQPLPTAELGRFALAVSHLALNDIADERGFFRAIAEAVAPGGRFILSLNNPYSYVLRSHVRDYFATGQYSYRGMAEQGVAVSFYQRTLAHYLDAAIAAGWRLLRLIDVPTPEGSFTRRADTLLPVGYSFPFFMILSLERA